MSSTDGKSKPTDKADAINLMLRSFDKTIGKGVVQLLSGEEIASIERISSGVPSLDIAMGGGYARGRIHELYGPESSGKTTLVLEAVREVQKAGGTAAFVDAEHAFDKDYARALGIDVDALIFAQPDTAEQALNIVEVLTGSGLVDLVILDSVAALVPEKELNGEVGDSIVGTHARLMSQAMRMLVSKARKNNVVVIFINQIRMKIGVMFGSPETTSGGNALKYFASIRMDIRRAGTKKVGEESVSNVTKVTIKKNKTAPPYRSTEFEIEFGTGVNKEKDLLQLAVSRNIVDKAGAWYSYNGERLGQGEVNTLVNLQDNPALFQEIKTKVYDQLKSQMLTEPTTDSEEVTEDE